MTTETLKKAIAINEEILALSLGNITEAHHIIPTSITLSFFQPDCDGINRQCTSEIPLSDEMRQIIRQACEDRIEELKKRLSAL